MFWRQAATADDKATHLHDIGNERTSLMAIVTSVTIDQDLATAFKAQDRRGERGEGDEEDVELSPPMSPPLLPQPQPPSILALPGPPAAQTQPGRVETGPRLFHRRSGKAERQRNKRRATDRYGAYEYKMRSSLSVKWSKPLDIKADHGSLGASKSAFIGRRMTMPSKMLWSLSSLKRLGFKVVEWDGL
jgi:hypothetical protein